MKNNVAYDSAILSVKAIDMKRNNLAPIKEEILSNEEVYNSLDKFSSSVIDISSFVLQATIIGFVVSIASIYINPLVGILIGAFVSIKALIK